MLREPKGAPQCRPLPPQEIRCYERIINCYHPLMKALLRPYFLVALGKHWEVGPLRFPWRYPNPPLTLMRRLTVSRNRTGDSGFSKYLTGDWRLIYTTGTKKTEDVAWPWDSRRCLFMMTNGVLSFELFFWWGGRAQGRWTRRWGCTQQICTIFICKHIEYNQSVI